MPAERMPMRRVRDVLRLRSAGVGLNEIARRDYNVLDGRISLPPWRKIAIALRAIAGRMEEATPTTK